jgi:hypothetical protein
MVKITLTPRASKGAKTRPSVVVDFPDKHPNAVKVADVKRAVEAKFPKVRSSPSTISFPFVKASCKDPGTDLF